MWRDTHTRRCLTCILLLPGICEEVSQKSPSHSAPFLSVSSTGFLTVDFILPLLSPWRKWCCLKCWVICWFTFVLREKAFRNSPTEMLFQSECYQQCVNPDSDFTSVTEWQKMLATVGFLFLNISNSWNHWLLPLHSFFQQHSDSLNIITPLGGDYKRLMPILCSNKWMAKAVHYCWIVAAMADSLCLLQTGSICWCC